MMRRSEDEVWVRVKRLVSEWMGRRGEGFEAITVCSKHSLTSSVSSSAQPFTAESLSLKKRFLEMELQNTKKKLSPKLKRKFQELSEEKVPAGTLTTCVPHFSSLLAASFLSFTSHPFTC